MSAAPKTLKLTPKNLALIEAYYRHGCNERAAYDEVYKPPPTMDSVHRSQAATQAFRGQRIRAELERLKAPQVAKIEELRVQYAITRESLGETLAKIAFCNGSRQVVIDGRTVCREVADREIRAAVMDLAELMGLKVPVTKTVRVIRTIEDLTDEELDAVIGTEGTENERRKPH